jgi:mitochondrial fission protein ELM1
MMTGTNHCWVIHDGRAGNRRQAIALAQALGWSYEEKIIELGGPAKWFAPGLAFGSKKSLGSDFRNPPPYVIGCGRQAAFATRLLKCAGSFAIQILDPRLSSHYWDVVIAPTHDKTTGSNVVECLGSLHDINPESLEASRSQTTIFSPSASPRTLVLLGGPSRMASFNEGLVEVMFSHLEYDLAQNGGSLMVCGSRRTPKRLAEKIRQRFSGSGFPVWFDQSDGENFYLQALAYADRIVVTPDSVNMISEACATAAPVFIAQAERASSKMKLFLDDLRKLGRIRKLDRHLNGFLTTPLSTMPDVVDQLQKFMNP